MVPRWKSSIGSVTGADAFGSAPSSSRRLSSARSPAIAACTSAARAAIGGREPRFTTPRLIHHSLLAIARFQCASEHSFRRRARWRPRRPPAGQPQRKHNPKHCSSCTDAQHSRMDCTPRRTVAIVPRRRRARRSRRAPIAAAARRAPARAAVAPGRRHRPRAPGPTPRPCRALWSRSQPPPPPARAGAPAARRRRRRCLPAAPHERLTSSAASLGPPRSVVLCRCGWPWRPYLSISHPAAAGARAI